MDQKLNLSVNLMFVVFQGINGAEVNISVPRGVCTILRNICNGVKSNPLKTTWCLLLFGNILHHC
jgi:hypothetical protein